MIRFLAFVAMLPLVPIICLLLVGLSLYYVIVSWIIQCKFEGRFAGMLAGSDVIWGLDEDRNSGVVNVLAFVEKPLSELVEGLPQQIITFLIGRVQGIQKEDCEYFRKLFLQRNRWFGYYFWTQPGEVKLSDFIRLVKIKDNVTLSDKELRDYLTRICNRKLFRTNNNAWELLVGTQYIEDPHTNVARYPILFRFHHSLGDGISILRFILDEVSGQKQDSFVLTKSLSSVGKRHNWTFWSILTAIYNSPLYVLRVLLSHDESNCLQLRVPTAKKIICWQNENDDCWRKILENSTQILPKPSYSNILLASLSGTLHRFFASKEQTPTSLTIAMPTRIKLEDQQNNLKNTFVTPMQKLQLLPHINPEASNRLQNLQEKFNTLQRSTNRLRSSSDVILTHWMMSILPAICPLPILRLLSNLFRITASVSIMPPLKQRLRLGPYELRDVYFWPPAFGTVGLNLSAISYGGQLRLTLLADRSIFRSCEEGETLLSEFLEEIERVGRVLNDF